MGAPVTAPEIRAAAKFLKSKGFQREQIPARRFAMAAKDLDCSFNSTLSYLATGETDEERRERDSQGGRLPGEGDREADTATGD